MANISSSISLEAFVTRLLAKEGRDNDEYWRYKQIACDALRNMHIHDFNIEATTVVTVNSDTNTFDFPRDFVRYVFIATEIDGRWWRYTKEEGMVPLEDDDNVEIQSSLINIADYEPFDSYGRAGGSNKYYFKPDYKNQRFQVGGYTPNVVVLKYISNGIDPAGDITLPDYSLLAIEDYVRWKISDYNREAQSEIMRLERQYTNSRREMRKVRRPTIDDIKDAMYASSGALMR